MLDVRRWMFDVRRKAPRPPPPPARPLTNHPCTTTHRSIFRPLLAFALYASTLIITHHAAAATDTAAPGPDWAPYDHKLDIAPGSIFDRAALIDAPAGKYGPLTITPSGQFEYANRPGQRVRFYGVNLCFDANFPTHAQADALADRLARSGHNAVRLHHYDRELVNQQKRHSVSSHDLDPAQLDRIDYLFAALKKTRPPHQHRHALDAQLFPRRDPGPRPAHRNGNQTPRPHLRNRLRRLGCLCPKTPHPPKPPHRPHLGRRPRPHRHLHAQRRHLLRRHQPPLAPQTPCPLPKSLRTLEKPTNAPLPPPPPPPPSDDAQFNRFLLETKIASDARMAAYLRGLGTRALLTGDNHKTTELQTLVREHFDVVDFHDYWNHPNFKKNRHWQTPVTLTHQSNLKGSVYLPRNMMPVRVFGKPFTVTEFNYVWPNAARAEGPLLMSGYAALQDWDGLYNFDYATDEASAWRDNTAPTRPGRIFSLATDPSASSPTVPEPTSTSTPASNPPHTPPPSSSTTTPPPPPSLTPPVPNPATSPAPSPGSACAPASAPSPPRKPSQALNETPPASTPPVSKTLLPKNPFPPPPSPNSPAPPSPSVTTSKNASPPPTPSQPATANASLAKPANSTSTAPKAPPASSPITPNATYSLPATKAKAPAPPPQFPPTTPLPASTSSPPTANPLPPANASSSCTSPTASLLAPNSPTPPAPSSQNSAPAPISSNAAPPPSPSNSPRTPGPRGQLMLLDAAPAPFP
ncbi:hypothetical protein Ga0100230_001610 [Opitutaceae bacterium TAV3]|nr:hypothetical protein Ga0100230_001610 [Opitutaceae bacterium TAV3]